MALETKIYQRGNSINLKKIVVASLKDLYSSRFLARQLAKRDISSKYRQSFLGIIWDFIMPLSTALVWIFINKTGAVSLDDTGVAYPLFVFSGTLIWATMTEAINMPLQVTKSAIGILSKINFPKEALILSGFYKLLFNSGFKFVLLIFFFIFFRVSLTWDILLFPLVFLILIAAGITVGLLITPLGLLYNDVAKFVSLSMRFIMYVTPVVYTIPESGIMKTLMELNPLTPLIVVVRNSLLGLELLYVDYFLIITALIIPLFIIALAVYRVSIPVIVERYSS